MDISKGAHSHDQIYEPTITRRPLNEKQTSSVNSRTEENQSDIQLNRSQDGEHRLVRERSRPVRHYREEGTRSKIVGRALVHKQLQEGMEATQAKTFIARSC